MKGQKSLLVAELQFIYHILYKVRASVLNIIGYSWLCHYKILVSLKLTHYLIFPSRGIGRRRKRMKVTFSAEESGCNTYIIQPDWHSCTVNQTWSAKNKRKTDLLLPSLTFFQYFQFNETIRLSTCCKKKFLSNAIEIYRIHLKCFCTSFQFKIHNSQRKDRDACNYSHII